MKKTIIHQILCMLVLVILLPFTAIAGDENDPEIIDNLDDQYGALIEFPDRIRTLIALALLHLDSFDFIDIDAAWFYENESEPEYLYAVLKLKDLTTNPHRLIYSIHFSVDGIAYAVGSHLINNEQNASGFVGLDKRINVNWKEAEATYDFEQDIVTFKLKKEYIGDPQPGNLITKTFAWTALRFKAELFSLLFSDGELVKDYAPLVENNERFGRDYEIQY